MEVSARSIPRPQISCSAYYYWNDLAARPNRLTSVVLPFASFGASGSQAPPASRTSRPVAASDIACSATQPLIVICHAQTRTSKLRVVSFLLRPSAIPPPSQNVCHACEMRQWKRRSSVLSFTSHAPIQASVSVRQSAVKTTEKKKTKQSRQRCSPSNFSVPIIFNVASASKVDECHDGRTTKTRPKNIRLARPGALQTLRATFLSKQNDENKLGRSWFEPKARLPSAKSLANSYICRYVLGVETGRNHNVRTIHQAAVPFLREPISSFSINMYTGANRSRSTNIGWFKSPGSI